MKEKTSITLSRQVLAEIDRISGEQSRSAFIEAVLRGYLAKKRRAASEARDFRLLNRSADALNKEVDDVLGYQADDE
jgi:metal-responsive CopG/Arc/MetJ family transcriptional regulator